MVLELVVLNTALRDSVLDCFAVDVEDSRDFISIYLWSAKRKQKILGELKAVCCK